MRTRVVELLSIAEADGFKDGKITLTVIKPGFNKSRKRFYPKEMLLRDYKVFEGAKMFADHQTESEARSRPEGSVKNWVATFEKVWSESDGTVRARAVVIDPPFKAKLEELAKNGMLADMGVSINAFGEATKQSVSGYSTTYVESLLGAKSVDFVTYAGAGGHVEMLESIEPEQETDVDLVTEESLRSRRPDLVSCIESQIRREHDMTLEEQLTEANTKLAAEKLRADAAEVKLQESAKEAAKANATLALTKMLAEAKLPEISATRIKKQFALAESTEGMQEFVESERDYVKSLTAQAPRNLGRGDAGADSTNAAVDLKESFKRLGFSDDQAKIAANF